MSDNFLSRWSKRKLESKEQENITKTSEEVIAQRADVVAEPVAPSEEPHAEAPVLTEADLGAVEQGGDIKAFMVEKVSTELRNKAFKALFSRPEFNVMDGLDIYIDDYNKFTPLSQEDITKMTFSKQLMSRPDLDLPKVPELKEGLRVLDSSIAQTEDNDAIVADEQVIESEIEAIDQNNPVSTRVIPDELQATDSNVKFTDRSFEISEKK